MTASNELPKIITSHDYPPIPDRSMDWSAVRDGYDGAPDSHCPMGHGPTEQAAIADLLEKEDMREDNAVPAIEATTALLRADNDQAESDWLATVQASRDYLHERDEDCEGDARAERARQFPKGEYE